MFNKDYFKLKRDHFFITNGIACTQCNNRLQPGISITLEGTRKHLMGCVKLK
jgi:hypothetical protein